MYGAGSDVAVIVSFVVVDAGISDSLPLLLPVMFNYKGKGNKTTMMMKLIMGSRSSAK